jgi:hypothetical protein
MAGDNALEAMSNDDAERKSGVLFDRPLPQRDA